MNRMFGFTGFRIFTNFLIDKFAYYLETLGSVIPAKVGIYGRDGPRLAPG
jgi:hypothetical protein